MLESEAILARGNLDRIAADHHVQDPVPLSLGTYEEMAGTMDLYTLLDLHGTA